MFLLVACPRDKAHRNHDADGTAAAGHQITFSYDVPEGHSPGDFAVIGQRRVIIEEGARAISEDNGFAAIANLGEQHLDLGAGSEIGSAISVGDVALGKQAHVHGDVTTSGHLRRNAHPHAPASVDGTITEEAVIGSRRIEGVVSFPDVRAPSKEIANSGGGPAETLAAGYFERLSVGQEGRVTLQSGEYFFDSLRLHSRSSLVFDDSSGPITLYVREHLHLDGTFEYTSDEVTQLTLVYLGADNVRIDQPFEGTLIAPEANVQLVAPESDGKDRAASSHTPRRDRGARFRAPSSHHLHGQDRHRAHQAHDHEHGPRSPETQVTPHVGTIIGRNVWLRKDVTLIHHSISTGSNGPEAGGTSVTFTFPLPGGVSPEEVDIAGITGIEIGDGVTFEPGCDPASTRVTASADGATSVGAESKLGNIVSVGSVRLSGSASVSGAVSSGGSINAPASNVADKVHQNAKLTSLQTLSWNVVFPADPLPELQLQAGRARVLYPEVYGDVSLADGAILYLRSGTYHFNRLSAAPGSQLLLESSGGPVVVYVKDALQLEGSVSGLGDVEPQLFVGYAGRGTVFVNGAFDGALVAPLAHVSVVSGTHEGQILARSVDVRDGVTFRQCSAPWPFILEDELSNPLQLDMPSSPVLLMAEAGRDASVSPENPVRFEIPSVLPVSGGNAGNGTASLTYTSTGGQTVTCTYRGGSSMEHPDTLLEAAKGREYSFESCTNGATAGSTATGTSFGLTVQGDSQGPGPVALNVGLGEKGCDGMLRAPVSPARSIEMLQAFSWSSAPVLPETNADGSPTLFYANIYLRNEAERELLDRFLIHYSAKPFFDDELEALYGGLCGSLDLSGDGNGLFVFAILPGATYNRIRAAVSNGEIRPEERVLFQAIVLRQAPGALTNADGSLDYAGLKEAGYYYLGLRALPVDAALDHTALPAGGAQNFIDAIEFVARVAREVGRGVVDVLGEIDRFAQGEVTIGLSLNLRSRDAAFADPIPRGWGPRAGGKLSLRSVRVEIRQWAQRLYTLGIPLPTMFHAYANERGVVYVRVAKGGGGIGGATSVRGDSGFCIDLETNAAKVTHFLLPQVVCNFNALDVRSIADGQTGRSVFGSFERNVNVEVTTGNFEMTVLSESTNTFDYTRQVIGMTLPQAKVLTGANASALSIFDTQLWAPCLSFPNLVTDLTIYGTMGIPIVGPFVSFYLAALGTSDIVVPNNSLALRNYGKITHEYGHYVLCGMLARYDESPYTTMTTLITDTIAAGKDPDPGEDPRLINEAFADFIAGQVVGGADYIRLTDALNTEMALCNDTGNQCWDENIWGETNGNEAIGRLGTLLHDAFDGHRKRTLAPGNGDPWRESSVTHLLGYTSRSYGDAHDEDVVLGGPDLTKVIDRFFFRNNLEAVFNGEPPLGSYRISALEAALGSVILERYTWCQACDVFLPHNRDATGLDTLERWEACRDDERVRHAIGEPPDADVRLNLTDCTVCEANEITDADGTCTACGPTEFVSGNTCVACGFGSIPTADGCVSCAPNEISVGNQCVACPLGQGPDRTHNVCSDCAIDAVVDWSTVPDPACGRVTLNQVSAPGDVCADELWVEAVNLNGVSPDGRSSDFAINIDLATDIEDMTQCLATEMYGVLAEVQGTGVVALSSTDSTAASFCQPSTVPFIVCDQGQCDHPTDLALTSAEVAGGRTSVRILAHGRGAGGSLPSQVRISTSNCVIIIQ